MSDQAVPVCIAGWGGSHPAGWEIERKRRVSPVSGRNRQRMTSHTGLCAASPVDVRTTTRQGGARRTSRAHLVISKKE